MKLLSADVLQALLHSLAGMLPRDFTGKVRIEVNFHTGTPASAVVGVEEGTKLPR